MKFRGAHRLRVTPEGDLAVTAGDAEMLQKLPVIYQETASGARQLVEGRYTLLGGNRVGVELAHYDRSRELTIDPVLVYSSLIGGSGSDAIVSVKMDRLGSLWVAGYTSNGDLQGVGDVYQPQTGGGTNVFLAKINPKNNASTSLSYFTYIGGSGVDKPNAMTIDAAGNLYVVGSTTSTNFPLGGTAYQNGLSGSAGTDAFFLKFNPANSGLDQMVYSTYLGGSDTDVANGVAVDAAGKVYIVGTTRSQNFPLVNAYAGVLYGPQDAFIAEFDLTASSNLVYSSYLGGELQDEGRAIAVTPSGTVYVGGSTESTGFPQAGNQYRSTLSGFFDVWLAQMDLTQAGVRSLVYSTYLGGGDLDELRQIALDPSGKVLLTGYTSSTDFPVTPGAFQTTAQGNADVFVTRVDFTQPPATFLDYSTYLGGARGEVGYDVAGDAAGNIYVTGYSLSTNFPLKQANVVTNYGGGTDAFLVKLDPKRLGADGLLYSNFLGTGGTHVGYGLAVGPDGTVYVAGSTTIQDLFATDNASQRNYGGGLSDGFVIGVTPDGN
jgi:hypothetical protein